MRRKLAYHHGVLHDNSQPLDRGSHSSINMSDLGEHPCTPEVENYSLKGNQRGKNKMHDSGRLQNLNAELLE